MFRTKSNIYDGTNFFSNIYDAKLSAILKSECANSWEFLCSLAGFGI